MLVLFPRPFEDATKTVPSSSTTIIPINLSFECPSLIPRTPIVFLPVDLISVSLNKIDLNNVSESILLNYFSMLKTSDYALSTINRKISVIKNFFHFMFVEKIIDHNPATNIQAI